MSSELQADALRKAVGMKVKNSEGESIGKFVEIIRDDETHTIQYLIFEIYIFYGMRARYFAIPASPLLFKMDPAENIILKISTDDLILANGTSADHYPEPHLETGQPIFELFNYHKKDNAE